MTQWVKNLSAMQETQIQFLDLEASLEEGMTIHSTVGSLENPMDLGAWCATVHRWQRVRQDWSSWAHIYSLLDIYTHRGCPGGSAVKIACNAEDIVDASSIPRSGRFPGIWNGNSLQYYCLENSTDRGTWQATVHGITKGQPPLSNWACKHRYMWIQI